MTPLIDADVLLHEIGWSAEFKDKDSGESILFDFDTVAELLDNKIIGICGSVEATRPPILFVSDSEFLSKKLKRDFVRGFRYDVAKTKPYKGNRVNQKPFHFYNILAYMMATYEVVISSDGLEADDVMCQYQVEMNERGEDTIICSRDKDLRICPGWHYSWECGGQAEIYPKKTDRIGWLDNEDKFIGYGLAFFYYQMLVGDTADHIPGLKGVGHVRAVKELSDCKNEWEYYTKVKSMYKEVMGDLAKDYFLEQASLLWMRYDGEYRFPKKGNK